jgi:hypothetical protein
LNAANKIVYACRGRSWPPLALAVLLLFGSATPARAGAISDTFGESVFGLQWGINGADVETAFPGGKWRRDKSAAFYAVSDARTVLGIERTKKQRIIFVTDSKDRLRSVSVEFPDSDSNYLAVLLKAREVFGPESRPFDGRSVPGIFLVVWPDDEGMRVTLSREFLPRFRLALIVERVAAAESSKEDLGFQ